MSRIGFHLLHLFWWLASPSYRRLSRAHKVAEQWIGTPDQTQDDGPDTGLIDVGGGLPWRDYGSTSTEPSTNSGQTDSSPLSPPSSSHQD